MNEERFKKQLAFILEADKEKNVLRQTHLSGHGRRENDAEHAWHMALMIYLLKEYANEDFTLSPSSPAFALGFKAIDTSDVGCNFQ